MKRALLIIVGLAGGFSATAQHHSSNWISRQVSDTTQVVCWDDSLTWIRFPPGSLMGMMGMMYDSVFARIDLMPMDSLAHPYDSTVIGWYRMLMGRDSLTFDLMHDHDGHAGHHRMEYAQTVLCQIHWDSLWADSVHRAWHPTGLIGWNGSAWVNIASTLLEGTTLRAESSVMYSATAIVGVPAGVVSVAGETLPLQFALAQNYPNPFNPVTTIVYEIPRRDMVRLRVFNMLGEVVATLVSGEQAAGSHAVRWDASGMSSGVYVYQLTAGSLAQTGKLCLMK